MPIVAASASNSTKQDPLSGNSLQNSLASDGELESAGRRYVTGGRLATILNVTPRTLSRWDARRIGPPKIKIGKTVLYDLARLPEWLEKHETEPIRARARRR